MTVFRELTFEERDRIGDATCADCETEIGVGELHVHEDGDILFCADCYEEQTVSIANELTDKLAKTNQRLYRIRAEINAAR